MASGLNYVHPDKDPQLFVNEVSVVEEFQNKGMGRELVKFLCSYGRELGCTGSWVAAEQTNIAARKAYIAAGGIEVEEPIVLLGFK